jgi:hypothetical protein
MCYVGIYVDCVGLHVAQRIANHYYFILYSYYRVQDWQNESKAL